MTNEKTNNGMRRGFYRTGKAWYADALGDDWNTNEIMFGLYDENNSSRCDGEMAMRWHDIGVGLASSARLECFSDGFAVLTQFTDVIARLAQTRNISEPEFAQLLINCGFTDLTNYKQDDESGEELRND